MNTDDILNKVKSMLKDANYCVRVHGTSTGCSLKLPQKKMAPVKKAKTIHYEMLKGGGVNITGDVDSYWICPDYATRSSIYMDILKRCHDYDYDPMVILYSNDEYDDAASILEITESPEGVKLSDEITVLQLAELALQNKSIGVLAELLAEAEERNVRSGLEFLISNFSGKVF